MLLSRAEEMAEAQGANSVGDKETVAKAWLVLRDKVDKSPTPAARAGFVTELNNAAQECVGRARQTLSGFDVRIKI